MIALYLLLAFVMGLVTSVYLPMVAQISRTLGSPFMANVPFFAVALAFSVILSIAAGQRIGDFGRIGTVPLWLLSAGGLGAIAVMSVSFVIPRIGTASLFVLMVAGQIIMGAVMGHFGLLNVPVQPITFAKVGGIALVIAGAALVSLPGIFESAVDSFPWRPRT